MLKCIQGLRGVVGMAVLAAAVAVVGTANTAHAGTITTITSINNPNHDLFADLTMGAAQDSVTSTAFNFQGATNTGLFSLIGTYDTGLGTVTGTFSANGKEQAPSGANVSFLGTIYKMDLTSYISAGKISFVIAQPTGGSVFVLVDKNNALANVSPVPLPSAAASGAMGLALLGAGMLRRRRAAV